MNNPFDCLQTDDTASQSSTSCLGTIPDQAWVLPVLPAYILKQDRVIVENVNSDSSSSDEFGAVDNFFW